MAKVTISKELLDKLAGLSHVKKIWVNDAGTEYHLTEPMVTKTVTKDKKSKRVSTPAQGWTEVAIKDVQAKDESATNYAEMKPAALRSLAKKRGVAFDKNTTDDDLILALQNADGNYIDPNSVDLG